MREDFCSMATLLLCTIGTCISNGFNILLLDANTISLTVKDNPKRNEIVENWVVVERTFDNQNPFLDSRFLDKWLESIETTPKLALLKHGNKVVGTALLGTSYKRKLGIQFKIANLNQSGIPKFDQIWIEKNTLFCGQDYKNIFTQRLVEYLYSSSFDLLHISMATEGFRDELQNTFNLKVDVESTTGFVAVLSPTREDYFKSRISKNTRYQISRSNKKLTAKYGSISVFRSSSQELDVDFQGLSKLHKIRWGNTSYGSGFQNQHFVDHLKKILDNEGGQIAELLKVQAGECILGYCLNFTLKNAAYFYCCGLNLDLADKHIKPGYSLHHAIMEYYESAGYNTYDFLGGDYQYKNSMSQHVYPLHNIMLPLNSMKGKIIRIFSRMKSILDRS